MRSLACLLSVADKTVFRRRNVAMMYHSRSFISSVDLFVCQMTTFGSTETRGHGHVNNQQNRCFVNHTRTLSTNTAGGSPWGPSGSSAPKSPTKSRRRKFIPPKAAVTLSPKARKFFKLLLEKPPRPEIVGR